MTLKKSNSSSGAKKFITAFKETCGISPKIHQQLLFSIKEGKKSVLKLVLAVMTTSVYDYGVV